MTDVIVTPARSLHRKLAEVMAEVERIPKNGTAPTSMGGFKFVQVGDAADAIRKALAVRMVSMLPTRVEVMNEAEHVTKSGGTMTTQTIRTTWTLADGESGETAEIQSLGTGADTGDKFSPKAQTNSMKYALLMGFLLSTGDDPELTDSSDRRARRDQIADAAVARQRVLSAPRADAPTFDPTTAFDAGLIGKAGKSTKGDADFELRQTPTGHRLAFRLTEGRQGVKCEAQDILAEMIAESREAIEDQRVTVWGSLRDESFTPANTTAPVTYQVLTLSRLRVGTLDLSAPDIEEAASEEPDGFDDGWLGKVSA